MTPKIEHTRHALDEAKMFKEKRLEEILKEKERAEWEVELINRKEQTWRKTLPIDVMVTMSEEKEVHERIKEMKETNWPKPAELEKSDRKFHRTLSYVSAATIILFVVGVKDVPYSTKDWLLFIPQALVILGTLGALFMYEKD